MRRARPSTSRSPPDVRCASPVSPLDVLDKVRRNTGSTVNDVVLAITGGALRRYLHRRGACPPRRCWRWCRCRCADRQSATGGNQLSALITTLATDIADPVERLAEVTRVTNAVKLRHEETGVGSLVGVLDVVPPRVGQQLARLAGGVRLARWGPLSFNVVVSNVPGPDVPMYCNGALVESAYPIGSDHRLVGDQRDRRQLPASPRVRTRRLSRRRARHRRAAATTSTPRSTPL